MVVNADFLLARANSLRKGLCVGQKLISPMLFPKNVAKLGEELNASVEYFVDNNVLSQSTVQPLLYKVQYAAEKSCKDDEN